MKTMIKYISLTMMLVVGLLMVFGVVGVDAFIPMLGASGTSFAVAISGGVTIKDHLALNSKVIDDPYEQMMTVMKPDEYPLEHLLRNTKKAFNWDAMKVTHPSVEVRPINDTINGASTATNDTAGALATITVDNGGQWIVDDIVRINGINGANGKALTVQIVAKTGNDLSVMAINGQGTLENTIPIIADGTVLSRVGNSKSETAAENGIYNAVPPTEYNFMQIHMGQIEESVLYKKHAKNIKYDKALQKLLAMYNFRNESESSALFGQRRLKNDPQSGEPKYFSGGAEFFIENTYTYGASGTPTVFTEKDWTSITKQVFTGNSGSSRRILFGGQDFIERISNISGVTKQLYASENQEIIWGVRFRKVMTEFGELLVKYHKMFDFYGYKAKGMVLDFNNIDKYVLEPFQKTPMDYDKTGTRRVESERFHETSCYAFKYPDTHAIIESFDAS